MTEQKIEIVGFGEYAGQSYMAIISRITPGAVYLTIEGKARWGFRKIDGYRIGDRHRESGYRVVTSLNGSVGVTATNRPAGEKELVFMVAVAVEGDDKTKIVSIGGRRRFTISQKNGLWYLPVDERPTGSDCARGHATIKSLLTAWAEHIGLT